MNCVTVIQGACEPVVVVSPVGPPGPAGPVGPAGGVTSITSPTVDGHIVVYNGTGGNQIKSSTVSLSSLATVSALNGKVDKVVGYGLSQNDFTDALETKLVNLVGGTFKGSYTSEALLVAAHPDPEDGSFAFVRTAAGPGVPEQSTYSWDDLNNVWVEHPKAPATAAEILAVLATDPDFNVLTDARLNTLNNSVSQATFDAAVAALSGSTAFAVVIDEPTTAKVLSLTDMGAYVRCTNVGGCDITIENQATVLWPNFPEIRFRKATAGAITLTLGSGVSVNNAAAISTVPTDGNFALKKVGADQWDLVLNF